MSPYSSWATCPSMSGTLSFYGWTYSGTTCSLLPCLKILYSSISWSLQPRLLPDFNIPDHLFLFCRYEVQQSISVHWLHGHLCEKVVINALQKLPGLLVPSCLSLSPDIRMVQDPVRTGECKFKASPVVWSRLIKFFLIKRVCIRHPPQRHPCWSAL